MEPRHKTNKGRKLKIIETTALRPLRLFEKISSDIAATDALPCEHEMFYRRAIGRGLIYFRAVKTTACCRRRS